MVGGQNFDRPIGNAPEQRLDVRLLPQGRIHFEVGVVITQGLVGQGQMMRANLAAERNAPGPGLAENAHAARGRNVLTMKFRAGGLGQQGIAGDDDFLGHARPTGQTEHGAPVALVHEGIRPGQRCILTMIHDRQPEHPAVFRRAPHQFVILHATPVIRDGHDPRRRHGADRCQLFALRSDGDRAGGENIDHADGRRAFLHPGDDPRMIRHRLRVGHGHHAGKTSRRGGFGPGFDRFLRPLPRLAQVNMPVDESRTDNQSTGINLHRALGRRCDQQSGGDVNIADLIPPGGGIDHAAATNVDGMIHEFSGGGTDPQRKSTAIRTASPLVT